MHIYSDYPFRAPSITLLTKIYHPNIDEDGIMNCCWWGLDKFWSPSLTISKVFQRMSIIFSDDPLCYHEGKY